jgi:hypothetical protein
MNRDDILKMEAGREMDALIAENLFGWQYSEKWGQLIPAGQPDEVWSEYRWSEEDRTFARYPDGMLPGVSYRGDKPTIENYSTDMKAAWEVVERMQANRNVLSLTYLVDTNQKMVWQAEFRLGSFVAWADTAPLAICRASLLAVMEPKE